jgi:hypothetical protein
MRLIKNLKTTPNIDKKALLVIFILLFSFIALRSVSVISWGPGSNYRNVSVKTTVNVTNAYPEVINISCNSGSAITLTAGTTKNVSCLVQIRDYNGGGDINYVNGTFYLNTTNSGDPDDNNSHYSNSSCVNVTANGYFTNWTCAFEVWYYATNGTWRMNSTVNDTYGAKTNGYGNTTISALLALNATPTIDFGQLAVTDTSGLIQANVTNLGNIAINVSVYGYGGEDPVAGAGLAMLCDYRNITLSNERYSINATDTYATMTSITGAAVNIPQLIVQKQTVPSTYIINSTYWSLHVNLSTNPFGICNGTVIFSAVQP